MGTPPFGVGSLEHPVDDLPLESSSQRDADVLAPFVGRPAVDRRPQNEELAVAPGELAGGEQIPAQPKPGAKELRVPRKGWEDVVVAEAVLDSPGDRIEDRLDLSAPLLRRQRRDAGAVRHQPALGPMVRPPSTIRVCPVM